MCENGNNLKYLLQHMYEKMLVRKYRENKLLLAKYECH